ncbi:MAG: chemotaxis protein CheB, partial [Kofleriaceae bacterium]
IKRLGGLAVIHDPADALHPEMPINAREYVEIDHVAPAAELGPLVSRLVQEDAPKKPDVSEDEVRRLGLEVEIAGTGGAFDKGILAWGKISPFTCPECHGPLVQLEEGVASRFRCHTGHAFTPSTLLAGITEMVEETLWGAMRGVEEQAMLFEHMARHLSRAGDERSSAQFAEKARRARGQARVIHDSIPEHQRTSDNADDDA